MATPNVPVEALNLPSLSDPKFVEYFRETKDQNMIIHFYECFKNIDITKFDKDIHENSKEMLKIIIHQRREFGERSLAADDMKNKIEERMIELMQENIQLNRKLTDEVVESNRIKSEMKLLDEKYFQSIKEKEELEAQFLSIQETTNKWVSNAMENYDALEKTKKENEFLSADLQRIKKEMEALEKEIPKLQKEKHRYSSRNGKDGRSIKEENSLDQSASMLRKHVTARKITQQAYKITSSPITSSSTASSTGRRQSQSCIRQQQYSTQSSTSIFRRGSGNTTTATTPSMDQPQPLHRPQLQQPPRQRQQPPTFPGIQQTRQFMSCIQSQSYTTSSTTTNAGTKTQIQNVSAIPLPPPLPTESLWINNTQSPHIQIDPFFSMPTMMPPTMPFTQFSNVSPDQQQYYLP